MSMSQEQLDRSTWRRWAGLEVLSHLSLVHPSANGRPILARAIERAYALIYDSGAESPLAMDVEILIRLASDGGWHASDHLTEARRVLVSGRAQDPFAVLVARLCAQVEAGPNGSFLDGVSASQAFFQGDPDRLLSRLRLIAQPFAAEMDLSILDGGPEPVPTEREPATAEPGAVPDQVDPTGALAPQAEVGAPADQVDASAALKQLELGAPADQVDATQREMGGQVNAGAPGATSAGSSEDRNADESIRGHNPDGSSPARDDQGLVAEQDLHRST